MDQLFPFLSTHPAYLLGAVVLLAILVFAVIKKVFQFIAIAAVLFLGYVALVTHVSVETQESITNTLESGTQKMIQVGEQAGKALSD